MAMHRHCNFSTAALPVLCIVAIVSGCSSPPTNSQNGGSPTVLPTNPPLADTTTEVKLEGNSGTFTVPVTINDAIKLDFTLDSGASDVLIPSDVVKTMVRTGTLDRTDFIGQKIYQLADGSTLPSYVFRIRSLRVGDLILRNVTGSIANENGSLLLGQSFLSRLNSWSINNKRGVLVLGAEKIGGDATPFASMAQPTVEPAMDSSPPNSDNGDSLRARLEHYLDVGEINDLSQIGALYSDQVNYYGSNRPRAFIVAEKQRYISRWPVRSYRIKDGSFQSHCEDGPDCVVSGLVDWTASDASKGRYAAGVAKVELGFSNGLITYEKSKVVSRR